MLASFRNKITVRSALSYLGTAKTRLHEVHPIYKAKMVAARRAGNDEESKTLSQMWAHLKKNMNRTCIYDGCDRPVKRPAGRCAQHRFAAERAVQLPRSGTNTAKVFACFNGEPMTANEVVAATQLPHRKVYQAIASLIDLKLLSSKITPTLYKKIVGLIACCLLTGCRFLPGGSYLLEPAWMDKPSRGQRLDVGKSEQNKVDRHEREKRHRVAAFHGGIIQQRTANSEQQIPSPPTPPGMPKYAVQAFRAPGLPPAPIATPTNWNVMLRWTHSPSEISSYQISYGPSTSTMTNVLVTGYTNMVTVNYLDPSVPRYYFNVRAFVNLTSNSEAGIAKGSLPSNTVKYPPDVIYTGYVERGPIAGPFTNMVQLFRFTNSPPTPDQGFKVSVSTEKDYAP